MNKLYIIAPRSLFGSSGALVTAFSFVLMFPGLAAAQELVVEPDDFAVETQLKDAVVGVTLTIDSRPDLSVISLESYGLPSTGVRYFGASTQDGGISAAFFNNSRFRADFLNTASAVSIDFIGLKVFGFLTRGHLEAFDCFGNLVDTYTTQQLDLGEIETATVTSATANIAYIISSIPIIDGEINSGHGIDNMNATVNGTACLPPDDDGDGVANDLDLCPGSNFAADTNPSTKQNRLWSDAGGAFLFGDGTHSGVTLKDTGGCSASQIIEVFALGEGHFKYGISKSAMQQYLESIR